MDSSLISGHVANNFVFLSTSLFDKTANFAELCFFLAYKMQDLKFLEENNALFKESYCQFINEIGKITGKGKSINSYEFLPIFASENEEKHMEEIIFHPYMVSSHFFEFGNFMRKQTEKKQADISKKLKGAIALCSELGVDLTEIRKHFVMENFLLDPLNTVHL